jgi:hypothetical protein
MDLDILPVQSYEEAIPFLRRPYTSSLIRGLVINAPDNPRAPCMVGLYAIGESLMDRLNLVCGREWAYDFEITKESTREVKGRTLHYCEASVILEVFGVIRRDIGEATAETPGQAKMNAKAQAWKRTGRLHGPGQCLYATEDFLLFRGEKPGELHVPSSGENPHKRPYIDAACERAIRDQYQRWLDEEGKGCYGVPLDHQAIAERIMTRLHSNGITRRASASPPLATTRAPSGPTEVRRSERQMSDPPGPGQSNGTARQASAGLRSEGPMPDHPASSAAITAARDSGFGEPVARLLCNLACADGQGSKPTDAQLQAVAGWLEVLSELQIPEHVVLEAAGHNARKAMSQERRQALFSRWLARKAAGEPDSQAQDNPAAEPASGDGRSASVSSTNGASSDSASSNGHGDLQQAMRELRRKMAENGYDDPTVTRMAALAIGVGPRARVDWVKVKPDVLLILADLLDSAGAIGWSNEHLDQAVRDAHESSRQSSPAGRFSALANHIKDVAETRAMEAG